MYSFLCETHHRAIGVSPAIWDHTVLLDTQQRLMCSVLTPGKQVST